MGGCVFAEKRNEKSNIVLHCSEEKKRFYLVSIVATSHQNYSVNSARGKARLYSYRPGMIRDYRVNYRR